MNRRSSILIALVAVGALAAVQSGCNQPSCGPGTVQQQQKDGTLKCVQTDDLNSMTPCEVDGGNVMIVGGKCVSAVQCDPASTIEINGVCVGIGNSGATCRTPAPGKACVSGSIIDFKTNMKSSTPIHVELYDPIAVLTPGATPIAMYDSADGGSYVFQDFQVPSLGIIVVTTGKGTAGFIVAGSAAQGIASGNQYKLDTYSIPKADSDQWGFDITTGGAQIAKFYKDPKPLPTNIIANETMPVAGVTLTKDMMTAAGAGYFNDTLTAVDGALTATGNSGVAIVSSPLTGGGSFPTFSGSGPTAMPITWEALPGGSAPGLVLITRFHPSM